MTTKNPGKATVIAKTRGEIDAAVKRAQAQATRTGKPVDVYYRRPTLDVSAAAGRGKGYEEYHSTAYPEQSNSAKKKKRNPSDEYMAAAEMSEDFHGTKPHELIEVKTDIFEHDNLADCGELVKLEIIGVHGGIIDLKKFAGARLAMAPKGYPYQLFVVGGDQSVPLEQFEIDWPHEHEVLGKLKFVTYYTIKHHLGKDGGDANFRHKFNDNGPLIKRGTKAANRPTVLYDVLNKLISFAGGEYDILPEGIDN